MTIEAILEVIDANSNIRDDQLDREDERCYKIQFKYQNMLIVERKTLYKLQERESQLKLYKEMFYQGKLEAKEYKGKQFDASLKIVKSDLPLWVNADTEMQKIREEINEQEIKIDTLMNALNVANYRNNHVKNHFEILRFMNGGQK